MKDKLIFFILGATVGSVTTFLITKKVEEEKCRKQINLEVDNRVNKEIADLKKSKSESTEEVVEKVKFKSPTDKPDLMEYYKESAKKHNYRNYSDADVQHEEEDPNDQIQIISSTEIPYGIENDILQYKYYADQTITDETGEPLSADEVEKSCGFSFPDFYGKDPESPDIVYVKRGERYFEISRDLRNFEEIE